ncbi:MAG: hypothetical protein HY304_05905 [candidate division Zixibacteria bacterium]|nr:hypothetical protein [candidate division Zixibacteria bacterium]
MRNRGIGIIHFIVATSIIVASLAGILGVHAAWSAEATPPTLPQLGDGKVDNFFTDAAYDPAVPTPEKVLGFPLGSRPVHYDEAIRYMRALADFSPRAELVQMGATHEGRPLYYLIERVNPHGSSIVDATVCLWNRGQSP